MRRFKLSAEVTVSAYTYVDAETEEQAVQIGKVRGVVIGGTGSGANANQSWIVEDADGEPDKVHVD